MKNDRLIVELRKPERKFTKVYDDFLFNRVLSCEEKLVFIVLRSFVDYAHDEAGLVFPAMETICIGTGLSRPRATRAINSLIKKGVVQKKRRGLSKSNVYAIADSADIWKAASVEEMNQEAAKTDIQRYIEALEAAGYQVIKKEKGLPSSGVEKSPNSDIYNPSICLSDSNTDSENVQYQNKCSCTSKGSIEEVYTLENLKAYFEYKSIQADEETKAAIFNILHNVLNTGKPTIRVAGEPRPAAIVKSRIMQLSAENIQHVINKYVEYGRAGNKIKNPEAFIITLLYKAKEQMELETENDLNTEGY